MNFWNSQTIDWPATWAGASAVLTLGLLIATGMYAWLTWRLVKTSEAQSWEIARARVLVSLQTTQGGQFMVLQIENVGLVPAVNLALSLDRPLHRHFGSQDDVRDIPLFREGLNALPPRTRIRIGFGVAGRYLGDEVDRNRHPLSFSISARYEASGRRLEESFPIDVKRQLSMTAVDKDYADEFGRTFPDLFRREIQRVATALEALRGDSLDEDEKL